MTNSYLNDRKSIDRLKKEYLQHGTLCIGFDFDCTIFDFHNEGLEIKSTIELLQRCSDKNFTMCLYSLSLKEEDVDSKLNYCKDLNINVDFLNESHILKNSFPIDRKKPFFSILLDDRCGLGSAYNILKTTLDELESENA